VQGSGPGDGYSGRFVWRIENFTRLKDLLKKRKITALCIKSRHFQIGNRDCRLIVYPRGTALRPCQLKMSTDCMPGLHLSPLLLNNCQPDCMPSAGQSQPPNHLSMFLEVTDPRQGSNDWSCFVSHRLTVVNQKSEDRAVAKESQVCSAGLVLVAVPQQECPVPLHAFVKNVASCCSTCRHVCPVEPVLARRQGLGLAGVCDADQLVRPGCWLPGA
jgi:hypothetical protein